MQKNKLFAILVLGITAVSSQIILLRELFTAFYGNELSFGFAMALWLFSGALGSGLLGRFYADNIKNIPKLYALLQIAVSLLIPGGVFVSRISRVIFGVSIGEIVGMPLFFLSSGIVLLPLALCLGFLFVLGCRMITDKGISSGIGKAYTIESGGAAIGGLLTSLFLIRFIGSLEIAFLLSLLNLISAYFLVRKNRSIRLAASLILVSVGVLFASGGIRMLDAESFKLKWKTFHLVDESESVYGRVTVTEREKQVDFYSNGLFLFSSNDPLTSEEAVHIPFSFSEDPKKILLIGGGSSGITREIIKYPIERVDYVEIDPLIPRLAEEYAKNNIAPYLKDKRLNIITADGRFFIKNTKKRYDVVIIHLPDPYTARINRFYTKEFFHEIKKVLNPHAVLSFGVSSSENYISKEQALFLKTLETTAKSVFNIVVVIPGDTAYFIISDRQVFPKPDGKYIANVLRKRGIKTFYVRDYYLDSKLSKERLSSFHDRIASAGAAPENYDFSPVSYYYDMVLWSTRFNFRIAKLFLGLTKKRLFFALYAILFFIFIAYLVRYKSAKFKEDVTLLALGTTGVSEIAFEILIVIAFQAIYGYVYYKIGIIITSFMIGLTLGSYLMTRIESRIVKPYRAYIFVQTAVFLYPLFLLAMLKWLSRISGLPETKDIVANIFSVLPFIAGFVGGMQYPLANTILAKSALSRTGSTAGRTYAADLLGSFFGALFISTVLIPIVGIPSVCVFLAGLNAVSLCLLLLGKRARSPQG